MKFFKKSSGFTLIELLVVISILSIVLMLVLTIFTRTLRGGNKTQIISAIKQNGQSVLETMDKTIRGSERVVCPATTDSMVSDSTLVVVKEGVYTKYQFIIPTPTANGYIVQEVFNLPATPPPGGGNLYIKNFERGVCANPMQNPQIITDTNPQTGASIFNGLFTRVKSTGYKDQVTISFDVKSGVKAPQAVAGQIDSVNFKTTIQVR